MTAVLVGQNLIVANVGDSRAVLSKGGQGEPVRLCMILLLLAATRCSINHDVRLSVTMCKSVVMSRASCMDCTRNVCPFLLKSGCMPIILHRAVVSLCFSCCVHVHVLKAKRSLHISAFC